MREMDQVLENGMRNGRASQLGDLGLICEISIVTGAACQASEASTSLLGRWKAKGG